MRASFKYLLVFAFLVLAGQTAPAKEVFVGGYTNGCFDCGTSVADTASPQSVGLIGLSYVNSTFTGTTANSGLALNAAPVAPPTQNTNNLGAFQLAPFQGSYTSHTFSLRVTFTAPQGISTSNTLILTTTLTGTVQSNGTGRVSINFNNTPIQLSYNDPNCEGDPATTCGTGQFWLRVEDVGINAGQTVALQGRIFSLPPAATGQVLISEFRLSGPGGDCDDFVELYNNTDTDLSIFGYTVFTGSSSGTSAFPQATINNFIPARSHHLLAGNAYSLNGYATPDGALQTCSAPATSAVGFFNADLVLGGTRVDGVVFSDVPQNSGIQITFGEGTPLPQTGASTTEHAWLRDLSGGTPKDTDNNAADFQLISTTAANIGGVQSRLGAPGPENRSSPIQRNALMPLALVAPCTGSTQPPNRTRDFNPIFNGSQGTLKIRRTVTNNTGAPVTRLRFRIVSISTFPVPSGTADLRALSSTADTFANPCVGGPVASEGLTLGSPPAQPYGGGLNSSLTLASVTTAPASSGDAPPAGDEETYTSGAPVNGDIITLGAPLQSGASVTVNFLLGVNQSGAYRFFVNVEVLP